MRSCYYRGAMFILMGLFASLTTFAQDTSKTNPQQPAPKLVQGIQKPADTEPPETHGVAVTLADGAKVKNSSSLEFSFSAFTDKVSKISSYYYSAEDNGTTKNGTHLAPSVRKASIKFAGDGPQKVYVWAEDEAGNISRAVASNQVIIDTRAPVVESFSFSKKGLINAGPLAVKIVFSEEINSQKPLKVLFGDRPVSGSLHLDTWKGTIDITSAIKDGIYSIQVSDASDIAGNQLKEKVIATDTVDQTPPLVKSFALATPGIVGIGKHDAVIYFNESMSKDKPQIKFGGHDVKFEWVNDSSARGSFQVSAGQSSADTVLTLVSATDRAGNTIKSSVNSTPFVLDLTPPSVTNAKIVVSGGAAIINSRTLSFAVSGITDANKIVNYYCAFNDAGGTRNGQTFTSMSNGRIDNAREGINTLYVWAEDEAGNISKAASVKVRVDVEAPWVREIIAGLPKPTMAGAFDIIARFSEVMVSTDTPNVSFDGRKIPGKWIDSLTFAATVALDTTVKIKAYPVSVVGGSDQAGNRCKVQKDTTITVSPRSMEYLAFSYYDAEKSSEAHEIFNQILLVEPENTSILLKRAAINEAKGDIAAQTADLKAVVRFDPYEKEAIYKLSTIYSNQDSISLASREMGKLMILESGNSATAPSDYTRKKKDPFTVLIAPFIDHAVLSPKSWDYLVEGAVIDAKNGRFDEAARKCNQAAKTGQSNKLLEYTLATIDLRHDDYSTAYRKYRILLKDTIGVFPAISKNTGVALIKMGKTGDAITLYESLPAIDKADPLVLNNLGVLYAKKGKWTEALQLLNSALAASKNDDRICCNLAYATLLSGNSDGAADLYNQAVKFNDENSLAHFGLGLIAKEHKEWQNALVAFRAALSTRPEFVDAHFELGNAYSKIGRNDEARKELERAQSIDPSYAEATAALASVYQQSGDDTKAMGLMQKAGEIVRKEQRDASTGMVVAISPFSNTTGNKDFEWLSNGIIDNLVPDLYEISSYSFVERAKMQSVMKELALGQAVGDDDAAKIGKMAGAKGLLLGSYQVVGSDIVLAARLIDIETGKIIATGKSSGKVDQLIKLEREIALSLAGMTDGSGANTSRLEEFRTKPSQDISSAKMVSEAKEAFYSGDTTKARELAQKAIAADPLAIAALSDIRLESPEQERGRTLAIMTFNNATKDEKTSWLCDGIPEALSSDLAKVGGLRLVERAQMQKSLQEIGLGQSGVIAEGKAPEIGKMVGAGVLLIGSFQTVGMNARIDARMVNVTTGEIIMAENITGNLNDILTMETKLAFLITQALNVAVSAIEKQAIEKKGPDAMNALKTVVDLKNKNAPSTIDTKNGILVAVAPFSNTMKVSEIEWLGSGIADAITTDLAQAPGLRMLERAQIDTRLKELGLAQAGLVNGSDEEELTAKSLGAKFLIVGDYIPNIDRSIVKVNVRLLNILTGEIVLSASASGSVDELLGIQKGLANQCLAKISPSEKSLQNDNVEKPLELKVKKHHRILTPFLSLVTLGSSAGTVVYHYKEYVPAYDHYHSLNSASNLSTWEASYRDANNKYRIRNDLMFTSSSLLLTTLLSLIFKL